MARKRQEEGSINTKAWLETFSDLMNLLLCFFVLLFAMSSIDESKFEALVASLQSNVSIFGRGATAIGDGVLISNGVSQLNELNEFINSTGKTADSDGTDFSESEETGHPGEQTTEELMQELAARKLEAVEELGERIQETVAELRLTEQVEVTVSGDFVQLSLRGGIMFDSGRAEIKEEAFPILEKVSMILQMYGEDLIEIEGHTDNVPISGRFENNEDLSSARARSIFFYVMENTYLDPAKLKHAGMGERVPIADNETPAGRARNRRVEIRIYPSLIR